MALEALKSMARCLVASCVLLEAMSANAGDFPTHALRLVSAASAGSASDIIGRMIANELAAALGVPVYLENKPGASGLIAINTLLAAPPDGYTVYISTSSHTVNPVISKVPYDPVRDFVGVTPLAVVPNILVVGEKSKFRSVKDIVDAAKAEPGKLNYASVGVGTATYMNAEKFRVAAGISATHIPFKGSMEAMTETISGRVDYFFAPLVSAFPLVKEGRLKALAVGTNKRLALLPNVPTMAEAGVANADYLFWIGMLVPAKTPRATIAKLNQAAKRALEARQVREQLEHLGAEPYSMSAEDFDARIKAELDTNAKLVKSAGIKTD
ncbi:tripartite tricarboxylate transporter substrate-binding protein [Cupriavidus sp. CV2]|uniref:tripartite tricarboxylate transporter substrate-binding protein n=1 Tax=Cupriavidus ulmosensis TaxID=3065913 RepID=UPI00296B5594|nr:tripartite tricarboxylate transporter substrate-binding protein [Cupriavidus sp. CV2]MDW3684490.1 tripartite tricarboxylate transporter substrate-binding protein [Cupriavidus sp. CV2]